MHKLYIYTMYIYSISMIFAKNAFYVTVILWSYYGYPTVRVRIYMVNGSCPSRVRLVFVGCKEIRNMCTQTGYCDSGKTEK